MSRVVAEAQLHPDYPLPDLDDPIMRPFWDGARALRLMQQRDRETGEVHWPPKPLYWKGGGRHKRKRISWTDFAAKMDELAYGGN